MRFAASVAALALLLVPDPARACSCMRIEPAAAFAQADAVFEGRVRAIERAGDGSLRVTLAVVQHWKGVESEEVVVETAAHSAACGIAFQVETSWLVYAVREGDRLSAGLCSRTARIEDAQDDLAALGAGVVPVEIRAQDAVEDPAPEQPPARGGCASCSASGAHDDHRGIAGSIAVALVLATRRRRARARRRAAPAPC